MWTATMAVVVLACAGCGQSEPQGQPESQAQPAPQGRRVFFIQPADGATVTSPVRLEFGTENFQIAAVPTGTVITETRPDLGHHHVAIDTDCLPPGTEIVKAAPWVHFGDGKNVIDMQLPPGQHRLTMQVGDDLHRAIEGLCATISVNVAG